MQTKFRLANDEDVEGIVQLCDECFDEKTSLEEAKRIFAESKQDKNQVYLVGEADGEIVAHAKVTIVPMFYAKIGTIAILNHVCVSPNVRRGGIGTKLVDTCFVVAKHYGCRSVDLWSTNFRVAAHKMYEKYGFEKKDVTFYEKIVE